ncbi:MAG: helix-turn-helix domain-containing protein [Burkholderiales bacterium]
MAIAFTEPVTPMSSKDERFFKDLGARVAQLRKDQGLTQTQLAERLGIAQQTLAHYEVGRLRIAASMLPVLAQTLGSSVEELIGQAPARAGGKRGPAPRLQQQLERLSALPKPKQRAVMEVLESMLAQAAREEART